MAVDNLSWAEYFRMLKAALQNDETYFSFGEIVQARQPTRTSFASFLQEGFCLCFPWEIYSLMLEYMSMSTPSQAQSMIDDVVDTNQARLKLWHTYHGRELFTIFEFSEENGNFF
jgi:hypothetical protein